MVEWALRHVGKHDVEPTYFTQVLSSFEKHYEHYLNSASGLYPQVAQTLQQLHQKVYKTALITNKAEHFLPEL
jgi:phosphoglycolate phosphatase